MKAKVGWKLLLLLGYVFNQQISFAAVSSVKLTMQHNGEKVHDEKGPFCSSPGEWLNESEEASDRDWMEAALLALRVTGPSRTGGCKHTETQILTSSLQYIHNSVYCCWAPLPRCWLDLRSECRNKNKHTSGLLHRSRVTRLDKSIEWNLDL